MKPIKIFLHCFIGVVLVSLFSVGCQSRARLSNTVYFNQHKDSLLAIIAKKYEPTIQPGDRIIISISALDPASVAAFNLNIVATNAVSGYIVEADGTIKLPQLGKLAVRGFTRVRLVDTLAVLVSKFVSDPTIDVQFVNYKITVLGEVNRPGIINFPDGKVTIADAIGSSGDLTPYARKDNILVIREQEGRREFGEVNILSINAFNSPYFNLQQNDIVYIEPTKSKSLNSDQSLIRNLSVITSILSVISTVFFLVINLTK